MSLYREVRPSNLSEIVGNVSTIRALEKMVKSAKKPHAILLKGSSGCGKTTVARILAKEFGSNEDSIFELNAANTRGIEDIREIARTAPLSTLGGGAKTYIIDECFPGNTLVLIDYDKAVTIEEICRNENIKDVLSYDLESKQIIKKKIIRRIKKEIQKNLCKTFLEDNGKVFEICSTPNHKFYVVGKGYVKAEDLNFGDQLIKYDGNYQKVFKEFKHLNSFQQEQIRGGICKKCGKYFKFLRGHQFWVHEASEEKKQEKIKICSESKKAFYQTERGLENKRTLSINRKGDKNPIYFNNNSGLKKLIAYNKQRWESLSPEEKEAQIKRFINAPKYKGKANKAESKIINMAISSLEFVGDGSFFLTLEIGGEKRHKNPDFVVRKRDDFGKILSAQKFVEVMDLEFWHKEDFQTIEKAYKDKGFEILIVDAKRLDTEPEICKAEIEVFANNGFVKVIETPVVKSGYRKSQKNVNFVSKGTRFVYNLEIEDIHNYFVLADQSWERKSRETLPILVSNCHQTTPAAQECLLKVLEDCPPNCYFILCTTEPANLIPTIRNRCTDYEVGKLTGKELLVLLEKACEKAKLNVSPQIVQAVAATSEGSPRATLVSLEKVKDITDLDTAIQLLLKGTENDASIIELCKLLNCNPEVRKSKWSIVINLFDMIEDEPEKVRKSIMTYLYKMLVTCKNPEEALDLSYLIKIFSVNCFYGGKSQLGAQVAEACFKKNLYLD